MVVSSPCRVWRSFEGGIQSFWKLKPLWSCSRMVIWGNTVVILALSSQEETRKVTGYIGTEMVIWSSSPIVDAHNLERFKWHNPDSFTRWSRLSPWQRACKKVICCHLQACCQTLSVAHAAAAWSGDCLEISGLQRQMGGYPNYFNYCTDIGFIDQTACKVVPAGRAVWL